MRLIIGVFLFISYEFILASGSKVRKAKHPDYIADSTPKPTPKDGESVRTAVFVEQSRDGTERKINFSSHNRDHHLKLMQSKAVDLSRLPIRLLGATKEEENELIEAVKDVEFMTDTKHLASLAFKRKTNEFLNGGFKFGQHDFKLNANPENSSELDVIRQKKPELDKLSDYVKGIRGKFDRDSSSNSREKRSVSTNKINANVEVVFICDFGLWSEFKDGGYNSSFSTNNSHLSLVYYIAHIANMMNAHYATMRNDDIEISVELAGLVILTNDQVLSSLTEDIAVTLNSEKYVDLDATLDGFSNWILTQEAADTLPPHDHTMLLTGYDIYDAASQASGTIGVAWTGGICSSNKSNSLVEVRAGLLTTDASTAAHELGHNLGAPHDSEGCGSLTASNIDFNYVMTAFTGTTTNLDNRFLFSCCSQRAFYGTMRDKTCFLAENTTYSNTTVLDHISNYLPGQVFTKDDQCYIIHGTAACGDWVYPPQGDAEFCKDLWCVDPDNKLMCINEYSAPADGTSCGQDSWCLHGQCVSTSIIDPTSFIQNQQCNVTDCYSEREFKCVDGVNVNRASMFQCVKASWVCDGENDCSDGSDELNCPYSECGGSLSGSGTFTSPNYPSDYENSLACEWLITVPAGRAEISFNAFNLEAHSTCRFDYIEIRDGSSTGVVLAKLCGETLPQTYTASGSSLYVFMQSDSSSTRSGFSADYSATFVVLSTTTVDPSTCGGDRNAYSGRITSQNYPNNYPNGEDCTWVVQVPSGNIIITIVTYDIEEHSTCYWDSLTITDYYSNDNLGTICGAGSNLQITGNSNAVRIRFDSDSSGPRSGFALTWNSNSCAGGGGQCISTSSTCGSVSGIAIDLGCETNEKCCYVQQDCNPSIHFQCINGVTDTQTNNTCVPFALLCDGEQHCSDDSDEGSIICPRDCFWNEFECVSGRNQRNTVNKCVDFTRVCDGSNDCSDDSDETPSACSISHPTTVRQTVESWRGDCVASCPDSYYILRYKSQCIPEQALCNGEIDCFGRSDENSCNMDDCIDSTDYQCLNGRIIGNDIIPTKCVGSQRWCDGKVDCNDNSDETNCTASLCSNLEFRCVNGFSRTDSLRGVCIASTRECDGIADCTDASDEQNCELQNTCQVEGKLRCQNGFNIHSIERSVCYSNDWKCDGDPDCSDRSDEMSCKNALGQHCYLCTDTVKCITDDAKCKYLCPRDSYCEVGVREIGGASILSLSELLLIASILISLINLQNLQNKLKQL